MKPLDWLLLIGIAFLVFLAVRYAYRHRREGCGGECSSCPYHQNCGRKEKK